MEWVVGQRLFNVWLGGEYVRRLMKHMLWCPQTLEGIYNTGSLNDIDRLFEDRKGFIVEGEVDKERPVYDELSCRCDRQGRFAKCTRSSL